jgi:hypothetical protein
MDRLQDERVLSSSQIRGLADEWIEAVNLATQVDKALPRFIAERGAREHLFFLLTDRLMQIIRQLCGAFAVNGGSAEDIALAKIAFCKNAKFLMDGQMTSMGQTDLASPNDWRWYFHQIMNHKNVEFLLTPFRLWCVETESAARFGKLATMFLALNSTYVHYQLLDDLADLDEDLAQGVIASPGFILLSQAKLGRLLMAWNGTHPKEEGVEEMRIAEQVFKSELLCSEFLKSPMYDGVRPYLVEHCTDGRRSAPAEIALKCAMGNTLQELSLPLEALASRRVFQGTAYLDGLRAGNISAARRNLLESNVPNRVLSSVGEDGTVLNLQQELRDVTSYEHIQVLFIMERLMRKTHATALARTP